MPRRRGHKRVKARSHRRSKHHDLSKYLGAGVYGGVRARVSNAIRPLTAKIPAGNIADELGMLGVNYLGKKFIGRRVPLAKEAFDAGMIIESARIGEALATGQLNLGNNNGSTNSSGWVLI